MHVAVVDTIRVADEVGWSYHGEELPSAIMSDSPAPPSVLPAPVSRPPAVAIPRVARC